MGHPDMDLYVMDKVVQYFSSAVIKNILPLVEMFLVRGDREQIKGLKKLSSLSWHSNIRAF